jgi:hypothetical protein
MKYITKSKSKTEEKIINGTTLTKRICKEYNDLLDFTQALKLELFDLYFKIKRHDPNGRENIPVSDDELRMFRLVDNFEKKNLISEISDIRNPELVLESLHDKKWIGEERSVKSS